MFISTILAPAAAILAIFAAPTSASPADIEKRAGPCELTDLRHEIPY